MDLDLVHFSMYKSDQGFSVYSCMYIQDSKRLALNRFGESSSRTFALVWKGEKDDSLCLSALRHILHRLLNLLHLDLLTLLLLVSFSEQAI